MFQNARDNLAVILAAHDWVVQLAGILPLSSLIDFIDMPPQLHFLQLSGTVPLWSWPITPSASRLLLAPDTTKSHVPRHCYMDRFGNSSALTGLDGRYGERYFISSPETTRLCVHACQPIRIENQHDNMKPDGSLRLQNLEIIHVTRHDDRTRCSQWRYGVCSITGWIIWATMIAMCVILGTYIALAFLGLMPISGVIVSFLYGGNPRELLVMDESPYNRAVIVMDHSNTTDWTVFYGESTLVNSLLNRPLRPRGPERDALSIMVVRMLLRICILGQWGLALAAAATQNWNAYFICFWVSMCIFMHAYILSTTEEARQWMRAHGHICLKRFSTVLSSRRALLNTIVALNPDTFEQVSGTENRDQLAQGSMRWIDPILIIGPDRTAWEQATMEAMNEAVDYEAHMMKGVKWISDKWTNKFQRNYWRRFILEGIYMAAEIRDKAQLSGRMVDSKDCSP